MLLIGVVVSVGQLTAGQDVKIIKDLGLAATSVFGLFIAIFIGIGLVSKEVERRSIYALLAKPVSRPQFIVGKYAGLVLTLAVNVAVMTVALYAVLALHGRGREPPTIRAGWDAPALDPALLKAVFLIFVELMLVTAIALFFSTFSSPFLSAALTFGSVRRRPLQRRPEELRPGRRLAGRPSGSRAARTTCCRTLARSTSRREVVHGLPVPPGYLRATTAYGLRLHRGAAARRDADLLAAGLQVMRRARRADRCCAGGRGACGGAIALQIAARSLVSARRREPEQILYVRSGRRCSGMALSFDALAADVYWIRAIQHYGGDRLAGPEGADASTSCSIRCSTSRRRSIRTSTSPIASARSS